MPILRRALDLLRHARRALKARLPYVRRREYRILRRRHDALIDALTVGSRSASAAGIRALKPLSSDLGGEICLFVTHASETWLKAHVIAHLLALRQTGFHVVLMVNTDLSPDHIEIEDGVMAALAGCYARSNEGFDFAAWGHAYTLGNGFPRCERLLLVNDSMIGPLDASHFETLMQRLRQTHGDMVGLTENSLPHRHLQSYFLAFGPRALASPVLRQTLGNMRSLPSKELVIDLYETTLTRQLESAGLRAVTLFPPMYRDPYSADDTLIRWQELLGAGFPYIKASLLTSPRHAAAVRSHVPAGLLPPATGRKL